LIRLLETPDIVRSWLKSIFELLLKYKGMVRLGSLAQKLVNLSKDLRHIKTLLIDKQQTKFVIVTIAEAMGVLETKDLLGSLKQLGIKPSYIWINGLTPASTCGFCEKRKGEQKKYIFQIKKISPCPVAEIPLYAQPPQGDELMRFSKKVFL